MHFVILGGGGSAWVRCLPLQTPSSFANFRLEDTRIFPVFAIYKRKNGSLVRMNEEGPRHKAEGLRAGGNPSCWCDSCYLSVISLYPVDPVIAPYQPAVAPI